MQISAHARQRMQERLPNYGLRTKPMKEFKDALIYGRGVKDFYGEFRNYLSVTALRYEQTNLKVHKGMVWIYEVGRQKLITLWAIPDEFQPYERYLNVNRNEYEQILEMEKKERDEGQLSNMMLESVLQSRPENLVRGRGRSDAETNNYDHRLLEIGYKECRCCAKAKPLSEFSVKKSSSDGYQSYCVECVKAKNENSKVSKDDVTVNESVVNSTLKSISDSKEEALQDMFSISSINQVIGFSDKLKEVGLTDKEFVDFISFIKTVDKTKYEMLQIFEHLTEDSRNLYLKMRG